MSKTLMYSALTFFAFVTLIIGLQFVLINHGHTLLEKRNAWVESGQNQTR